MFTLRNWILFFGDSGLSNPTLSTLTQAVGRRKEKVEENWKRERRIRKMVRGLKVIRKERRVNAMERERERGGGSLWIPSFIFTSGCYHSSNLILHLYPSSLSGRTLVFSPLLPFSRFLKMLHDHRIAWNHLMLVFTFQKGLYIILYIYTIQLNK